MGRHHKYSRIELICHKAKAAKINAHINTIDLNQSFSYGAPGVEFMGLHEETNTVMQIHFIPGQVSRIPSKFCAPYIRYVFNFLGFQRLRLTSPTSPL